MTRDRRYHSFGVLLFLLPACTGQGLDLYTSISWSGSHGSLDPIAGSGGTGAGGAIGGKAAGGSGAGGYISSQGGTPAGASGGSGGLVPWQGVGGSPVGEMFGVPGAKGFVAFDSDATGFSRDIYLRSADGLCQKRLLASPANESEPVFSADGTQLAFVSDRDGVSQIYVYTFATSAIEKITASPNGVSSPAWAPNGTLAYVNSDAAHASACCNIILRDAETGAEHDPFADPAFGSDRWFSPAFVGFDRLIASQSLRFAMLNLETRELSDLLPFESESGRAWPREGTPAPDGVRFAYTSECGGPPALPPQLFTSLLHGSSTDACDPERELSSEQAGIQTLAWGPTGFIAAATYDGRVLLFNEDTPGATLLVSATAQAANPAWAPADFSTDCD